MTIDRSLYDFNSAAPQSQYIERTESPIVVDFPRELRNIGERIGEIAIRLRGQPNSTLSTRDQLRFGNGGSTAVEIGGPKIGTYYDHEHKRGGGVRELLEFEGGIKRGRPQQEWLHREFGDPLPAEKKTIDKVYPYHYETGELAYEVVKYVPKAFRQRRPDPSKKGGYDWSVRKVRKVLFGLLDLLVADPSELVFVVEGEKDAINVRGLGCIATTNVGGSKKWLNSYNETLAGRDVVLLPDNDLAGREHVTYVAGQLVRVARSVRIVSLPGLGDKGDVSDWIAAGGTRDQLLALAALAPQSTAPAVGTTDLDGGIGGRPLDESEDAMAEAFSKENAGDFRYTSGLGWLVWDGKRYEIEDTRLVFNKARAIARRFAVESSEPRLASAKSVVAIETLARADRRHARKVDTWDQYKWLLNCPGGTVDLQTGELREHRREDAITKIANATPNPNSECPNWYRFLDRATNNNKALKSFLQRIGGMSLTGITRDHVIIIHFGSGRNGKSLFLQLLEFLLGDFVRNALAETFIASEFEHHSTDLVHLRGARLVIVQEIGEGQQWDLPKVKRFTGGDKIVARKMRQDPIEFSPEATLQVACNHLPGIRTIDDAIRDRIIVVPWDVYIPEGERDPELLEKLKLEADAILAWFVEGCLEWQRIGLAKPEAVINATSAYIADEDKLKAWIGERCAFGDYAQDLLDLYHDYQTWCLQHREAQLGRRQWKKAFLVATKAEGVFESVNSYTRRVTFERVGLR